MDSHQSSKIQAQQSKWVSSAPLFSSLDMIIDTKELNN